MNKAKIVVSSLALAVIGGSGLALIKSSEGLRTTSYADPVGIPTICYGHTGPEVRLGQKASIEYCEEVLRNDIAAHQIVLIGRYNCIGSAHLNQNQLDALTSFTFNVGTTKFCRSTMAVKLKRLDYQGAAAEFPKWANATHKGKLVKLPGLIKRRTAEKRLFEDRTPTAPTKGSSEALRALTSIWA